MIFSEEKLLFVILCIFIHTVCINLLNISQPWFKHKLFKGNTTGLSTTVSNLETNKLFVVHVVAWNGRGSSLPAEGLNFTLKNGRTFNSLQYSV